MGTPEPEPASASPEARSIGLAMSGGGYRASGFHLGALDYLEEVGLLPRLKALSTVSGGTFTGARFALSLVRREPFETFFRLFYAELRDLDLVALGLKRLGRRRSSVPSGREDLIVALADVYAETFFAHEGQPSTFGELLDGALPIDTVVFNATEFRTGTAFRFKRSPHGVIGNFFFPLPREAVAKVRMADIVAASSCFPGGFEPLAFPQDFVWPEGRIPQGLADLGARPLPLMDGGVCDNQGTESLLLADQGKGAELDLIIISDVDQKREDLFPFPQPRSVGLLGKLRLGTVAVLLWTLMAASAVTVLGLAAEVWRDGLALPFGLFTRLLPMLLALAVAYGIWVGRREVVGRVLEIVPQVGARAWRDFRRLSVDQVAEMIRLRLLSLVTMASSIFMKRIRALGYRALFQDPKYQRRRVSNLVYHLQSNQPFDSLLGGLVPPPSPALRKVADAAAAMPTALWFDPARPYELPCLVASGQATLCYNLMKHLLRRHGRDPATFPPEAARMWSRLAEDWKGFQGDPYVLLERRLGGELPAPP